ncbi:MAG: AAA family ATPase [Rhizobiales bacterium]|nr:AAA family ATPase [Hyphomicrobiales bacterium]MBI3672712.1 AAA family ATPase [Hyphomicrobiales bacterium]
MARRSQKTRRITRLKVRNWRNFREAEVHLAKRAFFIGPNASGKSNLLDAIRFLRDVAKPIGGGLASAIADRGGISAVRSLYARGHRTEVVVEVDIGDDEIPAEWTYYLSFTKAGKERFPTIFKEVVQENGTIVAQQERVGAPDGAIFSETLLEQALQNTKFRGIYEFFGSIGYLHVVPQIVRDPRRSLERGDDPFGGNLLKNINEVAPRSRDSRLKRIAEALAIAVPQFADLRLKLDAGGKPHLEAGFSHWRPNYSYQTEEVFSDGTLRLLGFLWAIGDRRGPLLLEEPELSLNDQIARQLPQMVARMQRQSGRQVLMTTHSEALISEGVGLHEVHRLVPSDNGTTIETASDNPNIAGQVKAGFTVGESAMPLAHPQGIENLGLFDLVDD